MISEFIIYKKYEWTNYFLAGVKGVLEHLKLSSEHTTGFDALISVRFNYYLGVLSIVKGTIPKASGLSSSSALVCAAALATMVVNGASISKVSTKLNILFNNIELLIIY